MKRDDALAAARRELQRHTLSTFTEGTPHSSSGIIVVPGCPACKVRLNTVDQLMRHLLDDVMPGIVDLIYGGGRESGMEAEIERKESGSKLNA